jgi:hypothetical protein
MKQNIRLKRHALPVRTRAPFVSIHKALRCCLLVMTGNRGLAASIALFACLKNRNRDSPNLRLARGTESIQPCPRCSAFEVSNGTSSIRTSFLGGWASATNGLTRLAYPQQTPILPTFVSHVLRRRSVVHCCSNCHRIFSRSPPPPLVVGLSKLLCSPECLHAQACIGLLRLLDDRSPLCSRHGLPPSQQQIGGLTKVAESGWRSLFKRGGARFCLSSACNTFRRLGIFSPKSFRIVRNDNAWLIWMVIRPRVSDCQQLRGDFDEQVSEAEVMHSAAASP